MKPNELLELLCVYFSGMLSYLSFIISFHCIVIKFFVAGTFYFIIGTIYLWIWYYLMRKIMEAGAQSSPNP